MVKKTRKKWIKSSITRKEKDPLSYYLTKIRVDHQLTQLEFAKKIGVCLTTLNHIENGYTNFRYSVYQKIKKKLKEMGNIDLENLL